MTSVDCPIATRMIFRSTEDWLRVEDSDGPTWSEKDAEVTEQTVELPAAVELELVEEIAEEVVPHQPRRRKAKANL